MRQWLTDNQAFVAIVAGLVTASLLLVNVAFARPDRYTPNRYPAGHTFPVQGRVIWADNVSVHVRPTHPAKASGASSSPGMIAVDCDLIPLPCEALTLRYRRVDLECTAEGWCYFVEIER